jgi:hypothetical protein
VSPLVAKRTVSPVPGRPTRAALAAPAPRQPTTPARTRTRLDAPVADTGPILTVAANCVAAAAFSAFWWPFVTSRPVGSFNSRPSSSNGPPVCGSGAPSIRVCGRSGSLRPSTTRRNEPSLSRRTAVTVTEIDGEETRTASIRAAPGICGPRERTGPDGTSRLPSAATDAEPSLARHPWIEVRALAGTPSAGTVTLEPPLT